MYPYEHTDSGLTVELLKDNLTNIFIETGTNTGMGVLKAIQAGYKNIYSIDIERRFFDSAKSKFNNILYPKINFNFLLGDSRTMLDEILKQLNEPATFWLDGHDFYDIPLLNELEIINKHHIKNHIIIIDDVRMFNTNEWNNIGQDKVIELLIKINKNYKLSYHDTYNGKNDILIAKV